MPSKAKETIDVSRPPKSPNPRTEVERLRERAKKAASASRSTVSLSLRVPVALYRALVELAEEYHAPLTDIAKTCLSDGARKYRDFATPRRGAFQTNPLAAAERMRVTPDEEVYTPSSTIARLAANARRSRPVLPPDNHSHVVPDESELQSELTTGIAEALSKIPAGALFPQGGKPLEAITLPGEEEDEDALA